MWVTGVQTCALPISTAEKKSHMDLSVAGWSWSIGRTHTGWVVYLNEAQAGLRGHADNVYLSHFSVVAWPILNVAEASGRATLRPSVKTSGSSLASRVLVRVLLSALFPIHQPPPTSLPPRSDGHPWRGRSRSEGRRRLPRHPPPRRRLPRSPRGRRRGQRLRSKIGRAHV